MRHSVYARVSPQWIREGGRNGAETERDSDKYTYKEMARGRGGQDGGIEMENGRALDAAAY